MSRELDDALATLERACRGYSRFVQSALGEKVGVSPPDLSLQVPAPPSTLDGGTAQRIENQPRLDIQPGPQEHALSNLRIRRTDKNGASTAERTNRWKRVVSNASHFLRRFVPW
jgi:hypothetical protein